jgi:hypothetical protein
MLIDVAISGDRNVIQKDAVKILKYKDLTMEMLLIWNVKTRVIPVIIGATGTISKSFRKCVNAITGNHEVKELQKTSILGTSHIIRKLFIRANAGTNDMGAINSSDRIAATLCCLGTWFVSGIYM